MHELYAALLAGCLLTTLPLELVLHAGVYRRPRRLVATLVPVLAVFLPWDLYAIATHQWTYSRRLTLDVQLPGHLPVEELAFFLVIPVCSILTLEAVRRVRGWPVGDEPAGGPARGPAVDPARGPAESPAQGPPPGRSVEPPPDRLVDPPPGQ